MVEDERALMGERLLIDSLDEYRDIAQQDRVESKIVDNCAVHEWVEAGNRVSWIALNELVLICSGESWSSVLVDSAVHLCEWIPAVWPRLFFFIIVEYIHVYHNISVSHSKQMGKTTTAREKHVPYAG